MTLDAKQKTVNIYQNQGIDMVMHKPVKKKGYTVVEKRKCDFWKLYETDVSVTEIERVIPMQTYIAPGSVTGELEILRIVPLSKVWHQSPRRSERTICPFPDNFERDKRM